MAKRPIVLVHGYSDKGASFGRWRKALEAQGYDATTVHLGNYVSLSNEITIKDIAEGFDRALAHSGLLRNNEPYRYALPASTEEKLRRLRVLATGERRKTGPRPGQPAVEPLAPGVRSKNLKGLPAVYAGEGLPPLTEPNPGEIRMLEQTGMAEFAASVLSSRRVVRNKAKP